MVAAAVKETLMGSISAGEYSALLCSEEERNTKAQKYRETLLSALHSLKTGAIF